MSAPYREQLVVSRPAALGYRDTIGALPADIKGLQGRIKELALFPIKSLGALKVGEVVVTEQGLAALTLDDKVRKPSLRDRMGMLVLKDQSQGEDGKTYQYRRFTQREEPSLVLATPRYRQDGDEAELLYEAEGLSPLVVPVSYLQPREGQEVTANCVKAGTVKGVVEEEKEAMTNWIREFLRQKATSPKYDINKVHLLFPSKTGKGRLVSDSHRRDQEAETIYSDGGQVLLASQSTLDWMNQSLSSKGRTIQMDAFRPNMVVEGWPENLEDLVDEIAVRGAQMETRLLFGRLCVRCPITQVDQQTGQRPDAEPLAWLTKNRPKRLDLEGNNVTFGINVVFPDEETGAIIRVGDTVEVTKEKEAA